MTKNYGCYDAENGSELCCGISDWSEAVAAGKRHAANTGRPVEVAGDGASLIVGEPCPEGDSCDGCEYEATHAADYERRRKAAR